MKQRTLENIKIESIGYGGIGIWRLENGKKVLVKGGLPWSVVNGRVLKRKKDYVELQITEVVSMDAAFLDNQAPCPHYLFAYQTSQDLPAQKRWCGGCKRQAISYDKQLELKHAIVQDSLWKIRNFQLTPLPRVIGSPQQFQYRNKIEFSCGTYREKKNQEITTAKAGPRELGGFKTQEQETNMHTNIENSSIPYDEHTTVGFHQQGHFAQVIDVDQCFLIHPQMHEVYRRLKQDLLDSGLPMYRVKAHAGCLRHVVIRYGFRTGQCMVNISLSTRRFVDHPQDNVIREQLLSARKNDPVFSKLVTTCIITENNGLADIVQNPEISTQTIRWAGHIFEELQLGEQVLRFQISPFSFFQTNTFWAEVLFQQAMELIWPLKGTVLDLYCGSGTIGISCLRAGLGTTLVGIEIVPEAIVDAEKNAQINWLGEHAHFFTGKVEQIVQKNTQLSTLLEDLSVIIIDPPRQGLHKQVVEFLVNLRRTHQCKLLYISCNPITFARDVELLTQTWGWQLQTLQPVDMFPQTYHIELIGLLT